MYIPRFQLYSLDKCTLLRLLQKKLESTKESLTQNINDKEKEKEKQKEQVAAPTKKNVFAKMKSYNSSSIKSAVVPLDQKKAKNVQQNSSNPTPQNADAILKENANRYTYQGKLSNFSFLKKVDRKLVDKNYALSFAEFKKLNAENKT